MLLYRPVVPRVFRFGTAHNNSHLTEAVMNQGRNGTESPLIATLDQKSGEILTVNMVRPSNFHAHLRSDALLQAVAHSTMLPWKYLLAMPNTGPIVTVNLMLEYLKTLETKRDELGLQTTIVPTVYLTGILTSTDIERMAKFDIPCAVKYYPPQQGATTGSGHGIPLEESTEVLRAMEEHGVRLLGHFESVYDKNGNLLPEQQREDYFMREEFPWLRDTFPNLNITIEHATTRSAIERVMEDPSGRTICGITPQAMLLEEKDYERLTWAVHAKCMPCAKRHEDRMAVLNLALSGDFRAHLGDDTAPHPSKKKLVLFKDAASGCFLPHSLALYAMIFHGSHCLDERFVNFACLNGPASWGLQPPDQTDRIVLVCSDNDIPDPIPIPGEDDVIIPFGWTEGNDGIHPGVAIEK